MATTALGAALTDWYATQQMAVAGRLRQIVLTLFPALALSSFATVDASWPAVALALQSAIEAGYGVSAALAMNYYDLFRVAEGVPGAYSAVLADVMPAEQLTTSLLVTGPYIAKGLIAAKDVDVAAKTLTSLLGSSTRLGMLGGRNTILENGSRDKRLLGYQRACYSPRPCHFCRMLRSRGPVYLSEQSGTFKHSGEKYHDHCHCIAEPVYSDATEWIKGAREDRALWNEVTNGLSGKDALNAFSRAVAAGR